jgi:hypothetical protein
VKGSCEHGNEPSGSVKCWEVLEWLRHWQLLKKISAALTFVSQIPFCTALPLPLADCGRVVIRS